MPIIVNLDVMMAKRKISLGELAERIDLTPANLSILKTGKAKAVRFSTLEAICKELDCQPGDILEFRAEEKKPSTEGFSICFRRATAFFKNALAFRPKRLGVLSETSGRFLFTVSRLISLLAVSLEISTPHPVIES